MLRSGSGCYYEVQSWHDGEITVSYRSDREWIVRTFSAYEAYMLGCSLRDHALAMGGVPEVSDGDSRHRQALYESFYAEGRHTS